MKRHPLSGLIPVPQNPSDRTGLVYIGGRISEDSILAAYQRGFFPWTGAHPIPWCSPNPRALLRPGDVKVRRSLEKRIRNGGFTITFDEDFPEVMEACASVERPGQPGTWITPNLVGAWVGLWRRGLAHSVEVRLDGMLVGGLYGLALGAAFFGESMFHVERDASKIALVSLCQRLDAHGFHFVDCQAMTSHLERMGAEAIPRRDYMRLLQAALEEPWSTGSWASGAWRPLEDWETEVTEPLEIELSALSHQPVKPNRMPAWPTAPTGAQPASEDARNVVPRLRAEGVDQPLSNAEARELSALSSQPSARQEPHLAPRRAGDRQRRLAEACPPKPPCSG